MMADGSRRVDNEVGFVVTTAPYVPGRSIDWKYPGSIVVAM